MKINHKTFLKTIQNSSHIYIMGHKDLDLDAVGSAIALVKIVNHYNKEASIIMNDKTSELAVGQVLKVEQKNMAFVQSDDITITPNDLIIVADTNKKVMVQDSNILSKTKHIMVIDHHVLVEDTIDAENVFIDETASSTCQMITTLLDDLELILPAGINTLLLAGVVLDTNNFVVKTDKMTYYSAYQLTNNGASPIEVQYLLKQDLKNYKIRQRVITNAKIYKNLAVTKGDPRLKYRREELAKIADTLLQFKGVEASFVIANLGANTVGISARSMGNFDVGAIMEQLDGGGNRHEAATKIEDKSIKEVETILLELLNK